MRITNTLVVLAAAGVFSGPAPAHSAEQGAPAPAAKPQGLPLKEFGAVLPENLAWQSFPAFPPEARLSVVAGDPSRPGLYVVRVKLPGGVKLMPHTHPEDRIYTVVSGVFYIGIGTSFDPDKLRAYPPGAVLVLPANTPHFHWARSGDYMTQVSGVGPLGLKYVREEDDPRQRH